MLKKQPVFFIGVPRSGTTVIFNSFSKVKTFGWISQYQNKFPSSSFPSSINLITDNSLLYKQGQRGNIFGKRITLIPTPSEAYVFYNKYLHKDFKTHFLIGEKISNQKSKVLNSKISNILKIQGKTRYVQKFTGPGKIELLKSAFPNAKFVHVVRHPVEVMNSLLNVNFWNEQEGRSKLWWQGNYTPDELSKYNSGKATPEELALFQWARIVETIENDLSKIDQKSCTRVHYADFLKAPKKTMQRIFKELDLESDDQVWKELERSQIRRKTKVGKDLNKYLSDETALKYLELYHSTKKKIL